MASLFNNMHQELLRLEQGKVINHQQQTLGSYDHRGLFNQEGSMLARFEGDKVFHNTEPRAFASVKEGKVISFQGTQIGYVLEGDHTDLLAGAAAFYFYCSN